MERLFLGGVLLYILAACLVPVAILTVAIVLIVKFL